MDCENSYRGELDGLNRQMIYCKKTNETCIAIRYCPTVRNYVNLNDYKDRCNIIKNIKREDYMAKGMGNKVLFEKNGILYVEILDIDQVREIKNPYDYIPEYVATVNVKGEYYIKGYAPK